MKTERRHELQTNDLALRLQHFLEGVKPYATSISLAVVGLLAVVLIAVFMIRQNARESAESWEDFLYAMQLNPQVLLREPEEMDDLKKNAQQFSGSQMLQWFDVTWADFNVKQATDIYLSDRDRAEEVLKEAKNAYKSVLQQDPSEDLRNRAHLGLARVHEMQNEIDEAIKQYNSVGGAFARIAKQRAEDLADEGVRQTIAWLSTAELTIPATPPGGGIPGLTPPFDSLDLDPSPPVIPATPNTPAGELPGSALD